ncbi:MAG: bifunctional folylpolyglutamate synthase/dihydrofolate synthase, partial [Candidatus Omnitrophica bacterium]|nr:bifunctional folylpolyglutamate synthase/dihydrofolate synthase [Candidatus Omnitrophota bacterium]
MTYSEALKYLDSFINYERVRDYNYKESLKLERMRLLAALLGNPQRYIPSVHVAGSKGKGSTAAYIQSIIKAANFKVGLYTSPHLISFRERIKINDTLINEEDLSRILGDIKKVIEPSMQDDRPTFFEVYTALAFMYFKEKNVDFVVYETGLGGRLDATNVIEPLVSAITPISYEHTDKLGSTLKEIAGEKCGIIKKDSICVSAPQEKEALDVIESVCGETRSRLILVGRDVTFKDVKSDDEEVVFNVSGALGEYPLLKTSLLGPHQMMNAALAIAAVEAMALRGTVIPMDAVRNGIESACWEGRIEVVKRKPFMILDGAQNRASANALANAIKKIFKYKKLILVFGVSKDKDVKGILEELLPISDSVILTKSKVAMRAMRSEKIKVI